ncbi:flagellar export protein FliJ [Adhaeretor mobilis]|uniref:Flagellar FliJ protein n=1 Tax=Adhaeretor mobilis TaxID=1930276 RepID=A0A517MYW0_9BACT|nr:flagellar export protein FliJ [Adhaeretor mobilis]QDT00050.1 Flagellar FliJ protein [Adhaeretor mobilis]
MARYQFQLETLRKLRQRHRDERSLKLAEAFRAEQILADRRSEIDQEIVELRSHQRGIVESGNMNTTQLLESQRYQASLESQLQVMSQQASTLNEEIERRREALVEADREVRVLDKLDERRHGEHRLERQRDEAKVLDEIGLRRHGGAFS